MGPVTKTPVLPNSEGDLAGSVLKPEPMGPIVVDIYKHFHYNVYSRFDGAILHNHCKPSLPDAVLPP